MAWAVMAMIGVCLPVWRSVSRMIRVASKPFISGISTSISTTSKLEVAVLPLALGGFDLQPDIGEVKVAVDEGDVVDRADAQRPSSSSSPPSRRGSSRPSRCWRAPCERSRVL